jgi:hypothetical protein
VGGEPHRERNMISRRWALVEVAARLLERSERDAVLGDLLEAGEGAWRGSLDVLGLVILRQLLHWKSWQPWLATFGLALPGSLLLMGISVSVSSMFVRLIDLKIPGAFAQVIHDGFLQLLWGGLLLVGCSWACGFVLGSLSRRTLWVSIASSCFACSFCFVRFREPSLSRLCLFLFLLPAICGISQALRSIRINLALAIFLALAITTFMILLSNSKSLWTSNWSLLWPAWYIVATSATRGQKSWTELK